MTNRNFHKRLTKATNFLNKNDGWSNTNIIDYFIKKFANDDPSMLASIYNDIPDEEKSDLINAINNNNDTDEELLEIYEQIKNMHKRDGGLVLARDGDVEVTISDVLDTLNIGPGVSE